MNYCIDTSISMFSFCFNVFHDNNRLFKWNSLKRECIDSKSFYWVDMAYCQPKCRLVNLLKELQRLLTFCASVICPGIFCLANWNQVRNVYKYCTHKKKEILITRIKSQKHVCSETTQWITNCSRFQSKFRIHYLNCFQIVERLISDFLFDSMFLYK